MRASKVQTPAGPLSTDVDPGAIWRVGYKPDPWAWTPWQYATDGRFPGRWDDPRGEFRTVYVARTLLACLLEVLAPFRPDPALSADLDAIEDDPEDTAQYPTVAPGLVDRSWLQPRATGSGTLAGRYAAVTRAGSLATVRGQFLPLAKSLGHRDLDAGVLKLADPRALTQAIAGWLYRLYRRGEPLVDGVRFDSRHGDGQPMWAVFERPGDVDVSAQLADLIFADLVDSAELARAFSLHGLDWRL